MCLFVWNKSDTTWHCCNQTRQIFNRNKCSLWLEITKMVWVSRVPSLRRSFSEVVLLKGGRKRKKELLQRCNASQGKALLLFYIMQLARKWINTVCSPQKVTFWMYTHVAVGQNQELVGTPVAMDQWIRWLFVARCFGSESRSSKAVCPDPTQLVKHGRHQRGHRGTGITGADEDGRASPQIMTTPLAPYSAWFFSAKNKCLICVFFTNQHFKLCDWNEQQFTSRH